MKFVGKLFNRMIDFITDKDGKEYRARLRLIDNEYREGMTRIALEYLREIKLIEEKRNLR